MPSSVAFGAYKPSRKRSLENRDDTLKKRRGIPIAKHLHRTKQRQSEHFSAEEDEEVIFSQGLLVQPTVDHDDTPQSPSCSLHTAPHGSVVVLRRHEPKAFKDVLGDTYVAEYGETQEQLNSDWIYPKIIGFKGPSRYQIRQLRQIYDKRMYTVFIRGIHDVISDSEDEQRPLKIGRYFTHSELSLYKRLAARLKFLSRDFYKQRWRAETSKHSRSVVTFDRIKFRGQSDEVFALPERKFAQQVEKDDLTVSTHRSWICVLRERPMSCDSELNSFSEVYDQIKRAEKGSLSQAIETLAALKTKDADKWSLDTQAMSDILMQDLRSRGKSSTEVTVETSLDWVQRFCQRYGALSWVWDYSLDIIEKMVSDLTRLQSFHRRLIEIHSVCRSHCALDHKESHFSLDLGLFRLYTRFIQHALRSGMHSIARFILNSFWLRLSASMSRFKRTPEMLNTIEVWWVRACDTVEGDSRQTWQDIWKNLCTTKLLDLQSESLGLSDATVAQFCDCATQEISFLAPDQKVWFDEIRENSLNDLEFYSHFSLSSELWIACRNDKSTPTELLLFLRALGLPTIGLSSNSSVCVLMFAPSESPIPALLPFCLLLQWSGWMAYDTKCLQALVHSAPSVSLLRLLLQHLVPPDLSSIWSSAAAKLYDLGEGSRGDKAFEQASLRAPGEARVCLAAQWLHSRVKHFMPGGSTYLEIVDEVMRSLPFERSESLSVDFLVLAQVSLHEQFIDLELGFSESHVGWEMPLPLSIAFMDMALCIVLQPYVHFPYRQEYNAVIKQLIDKIADCFYANRLEANVIERWFTWTKLLTNTLHCNIIPEAISTLYETACVAFPNNCEFLLAVLQRDIKSLPMIKWLLKWSVMTGFSMDIASPLGCAGLACLLFFSQEWPLRYREALRNWTKSAIKQIELSRLAVSVWCLIRTSRLPLNVSADLWGSPFLLASSIFSKQQTNATPDCTAIRARLEQQFA